MAEVSLTIGGRTHRVACRDGGEEELTAAAALLDEQVRLVAEMGPASEARSLLMAGLLMADQLREERAGGFPPSKASTPDAAFVERLEALADRAESLARALATDTKA